MNRQAAVPDASSQIASFIFAVLLLDEKAQIVQANPAAEDMLGRSATRLVGQAMGDCFEISDPRVSDSLIRGEGRLVARGIHMRSGGIERRVNLTSSPIQGYPGWRILTFSEAPLENPEETGVIALRAPAVLAHEIKNPLSAIRGASQLLERRLDPRDRPLAGIIANEVDRIAALIDRMQQLGSRSEARLAPCNLHEAIRNAMASVRAARGNDVELAEEFDPSLPTVSADAMGLEQVLINLLVNACDASRGVPDARVIVRTRFVSGLTVRAIRCGKATRLPIEICIIDNGQGIDADLRDHIFEPFVTTKRHGQGLGLALVRKLVRDMGGRIGHERDERAGLTIFRIHLALAGEN